ncbi:MAG: S-layer homology domain-containing protein, partial [Lachnospiraceae bacterium]|nr:S-layer homology domain-containing protein [Lachnospiraceae bacterium]
MLKRKIMGLLLAAAMLVTMLPASALTAQAEEALPEETAAAAEALPAEAADTEDALPMETVEPALTAEEEDEAAEAEEPVLTEQAEISTIHVTGVTAPATGAYATTSGIGVTTSSYCTISNVYWYDVLNSRQMSSTDRFQSGVAYQLEITFKPNTGFVFADKEDMHVYLDGVSSSVIYGTTIYAAGGGTYPNRSADICFYALDNYRIRNVYLNGIAAPSAGAHAGPFSGYSFAPQTGIGVNGIMQWRCVETDEILDRYDVFEYGMTYRMELSFYPKNGYVFDTIYNITASWNDSTTGFTPHMWIDADYANAYGQAGLRIDYTFPRVGGPFTTVYSTYIKHLPMPYPGDPVSEHLYLTELSTEHYSVQVSHWRDYSPGQAGRLMSSSETFRPGGRYQLELVMTPDEGYWFTSVGYLGLTIGNIDSGRYTHYDQEYNSVYPTAPSRPDKRVVFVTFQMPGAFTDVANESDFWYRPVYWGASEGITAGWSDNTFRPWNTCNRASIITFLWRLAGSPMQHANDKPVFSDVDGGIDNGETQFYPAIMWGVGEGIISGYSDGTFRPWNTCNRMQIATFLYRFAIQQN